MNKRRRKEGKRERQSRKYGKMSRGTYGIDKGTMKWREGRRGRAIKFLLFMNHNDKKRTQEHTIQAPTVQKQPEEQAHWGNLLDLISFVCRTKGKTTSLPPPPSSCSQNKITPPPSPPSGLFCTVLALFWILSHNCWWVELGWLIARKIMSRGIEIGKHNLPGERDSERGVRG